LVLAFIMLVILNRFSHFLVLPGMLAGITVLFYGVATFTHTPISTLHEQGWLLGPFTSGTLLPAISLRAPNKIKQSVVA
jgi:SulP family sulfate permease